MTNHEAMSGSHQPGANTVLDPVCGMHVEPEKARASVEHKGKRYLFCSVRCGERFSAEPEKFLAQRPQAGLVQLGESPAVKANPQPSAETPAQAQGKNVVFVCPMCPEVREEKPVPCPSCGMALEP